MRVVPRVRSRRRVLRGRMVLSSKSKAALEVLEKQKKEMEKKLDAFHRAVAYANEEAVKKAFPLFSSKGVQKGLEYKFPSVMALSKFSKLSADKHEFKRHFLPIKLLIFFAMLPFKLAAFPFSLAGRFGARAIARYSFRVSKIERIQKKIDNGMKKSEAKHAVEAEDAANERYLKSFEFKKLADPKAYEELYNEYYTLCQRIKTKKFGAGESYELKAAA